MSQERIIADAVRAAFEVQRPLAIRGSGSKAFHVPAVKGEPLDMRGHRGVTSYEPSELVLTARAGTPLAEIEQLLADNGQMLACEPPHFGPGATLGGAVACGLSGPRRPYAGSLRDFVLGVRMINGKGEVLGFGGQVMKNVAGFDVSRLMVGAFGTLGVLLEISLKVLPRPEFELTLRQSCREDEAIARCASWAGKPLPVSAAAWLEGVLHVRLSGSRVAVQGAAQVIGGEIAEDGEEFWRGVREQSHACFRLDQGQRLWRLSLPPATPPFALGGRGCLDWGGAQRWLVSGEEPGAVHAAARGAGGYAMLFRGEGRDRVRLAPGVAAMQRRIKTAFDPAGILNMEGA